MKKFILIVAMLAILPSSALLANSKTAQIITQIGHPVDCLSPVAITKIDGEQKLVSAQRFDIEPGLHAINGRAILDTTYCKINRSGNHGGFAPDLEMEFEAGKTYYIGYDHKPKNREDWKLVVWKVE